MKKISIIYVLIVALLLSFSLTGCRFEEENIFSDSPAVRMEKALKSYNEILCAASNGWVMEYFPTDTTEGYTFLMKFNTSTKVVMAAKNKWIKNIYTTDSCVFNLSGDAGPVLSFPMSGTYKINGTDVGIFHLFSNPVDPRGGSGLDGYGLEGDYEFVIMSASNDSIVLKGKKRGTNILMRKLDASTSWPDYFAQIDAMSNELFQNNHLNLNLVFNKVDKYILKNDLVSYGSNANKFRIYKDGGDPITDGTDYSFIVTPRGIKFHKAFNKAQTFNLSDDKQKLICADKDVDAYITGQNPAAYYFSDTSNTWNFLFTKTMGSTFSDIYNTIVTNCAAKLKEKFTNLYFKYNVTRNTYTLNFKSGKYNGILDFTRTSNGADKVAFLYSGNGDANGVYYLKNVTGFQDLVNKLSQEFIVSADSGLNLSILKFTAVNDPNMSFYVSF